jgi:hypothetical protein
LEDHGARVPDQDCLEYGLIEDIGNRNDFTKRVFQSTGWYSVRCPDIHFARESTLPYPGRLGCFAQGESGQQFYFIRNLPFL